MVKIALVAVAAASFIASAADAAERHPATFYKTYVERAAITHDVGTKHVVGYFQTGENACDMMLIVAESKDERQAVFPTRIVFKIAAAEVAELQVDERRAIRVACSEDAQLVKVAVFDDLQGF